MKNWSMKRIIGVISYTILLFAFIMRVEAVISALQFLLYVVSPLLVGVLFALAIDCPVCFFERKVFTKATPRGARVISVVVSCVLIIGSVAALLAFSLPDIIDTVGQIIGNLPEYIEKVMAAVDALALDLGLSILPSGALLDNWQNIAAKLGESMSTFVVSLYSFSQGLVRLLLSLVFSIYLLLDKKRIKTMLQRVLAAFFRPAVGGRIYEYTQLCAVTFKSFIAGQILEALILGALCFIGMLIIRLPYASVISVLIGVTSIIPVLGAYLGAIPAALLLLLENPIQALVFLVFLIALQQFENAVIYPKVVGDAIGIDGLFVFVGVTLGAGLGGVTGLIVGVPLVAVLYVVLGRIVREREASVRRKTQIIKEKKE